MNDQTTLSEAASPASDPDGGKGLGAAAGSKLDTAIYLADGILKALSSSSDHCQRLQAKGGTWTPDHSEETDLGGLNRHGLTGCIHRLLMAHSQSAKLSYPERG